MTKKKHTNKKKVLKKVKKAKKKVVRKVKKAKKKSVVRTQEVRIVVQATPPITTAKDLEPIKEQSKYMIPKSWVSEKQVLRLVQKTPPQHIYNRPAKGGGTWAYVTGNYVEKVLNFCFGWNWDFDILDHGREGDMVWVKGKLTVKDDHGHSISKSQFGRADIKFKRDGKGMLDYGNDLKSAATDSLKKCSSLLGIASDVYGKTEIKAETGKEVVDYGNGDNGHGGGQKLAIEGHSAPQELKKGQVIGPDGEPTYVCQKDGDPISDQVAEYSLKVYGKRLCKEHQK